MQRNLGHYLGEEKQIKYHKEHQGIKQFNLSQMSKMGNVER